MSEPTDKSIAARLDGYRKTLGVGTPAAFAVETIMSKAQKENWITGERLDAANARVAELEDKTNNLSLLVVRLARRVRVFEKGSDVATKALDYLVRSGLMPSVLRNEKQ